MLEMPKACSLGKYAKYFKMSSAENFTQHAAISSFLCEIDEIICTCI